MRAILSVYEKTGIVDFAAALTARGVELVSTGGTYKALEEAGLPIRRVSDLTGFPEILDGRVKTLHPNIHAGILARRDIANHNAQLSEFHIDAIDLVAVNLYPFMEAVRHPAATIEDALENIDIGGPTMIRAAAKNFVHVVVVVDPTDYRWIERRLSGGASLTVGALPLTLKERKELARKAFQHVALYDTAIAQYLSGEYGPRQSEVTLGYTRLYDLRYGENPHQRASLYADLLADGGIVKAKQHHGAELSFNNILDADAAWRVVLDFAESAVTIVKHTTPCGIALGPEQPQTYRRALDGDSASAYGGIVGFNRPVTAATAEAMRGVFYEVVVAPGYEPEALEILTKRRNLRVLEVSSAEGPLKNLDVRSVSGGALLQDIDALEEDPSSWRVVTERRPTKEELADLAFAWKVVKHVKSNGIILAKDGALVGVGVGQPSRVNSVQLALQVAGNKAKGSVLASDAFFPFADNVEHAATGGVIAVAQPGGSIRDEDVIAAADKLNVAMVFTGTRHFRH